MYQTLEEPFVPRTVDRAIERACPVIWNSDQGSYFTSERYLGRLRERNIGISMDGKGCALDNSFTERFWRSVKYENVFLREYASPKEAMEGVDEYIRFYNDRVRTTIRRQNNMMEGRFKSQNGLWLLYC